MPATQTSEPFPRVLYAAARPPWVAGHGSEFEGGRVPLISFGWFTATNAYLRQLSSPLSPVENQD